MRVSLGLEETPLIKEENNPNRYILKNSQPRFKEIYFENHSSSMTWILDVVGLETPYYREYINRTFQEVKFDDI